MGLEIEWMAPYNKFYHIPGLRGTTALEPEAMFQANSS